MRAVAVVVAVVLGALVALTSCTKTAMTPPARTPPAAAPSTASTAGTAGHAVSFIEDDVDAALKSASASGKVVFVDAWAPWCHTCLSMQRDVLSDTSLAAYEDRVVFAAVDTDKPEAASFVAQFAMKAWPTFFVIDPSTKTALAEHGGSLSLDELRALIDEALRTRDPAHASTPQVRALLEGHALFAKKQFAEAAKKYVDAARMPGPRVADASLAAIQAFSRAHDDAGCIDVGLQELGKFRTSSSSSDFVGYVVSCATNLDAKDPKRAEALTAARTAIARLTESPPPGASVDDKADALAILADCAQAQGDVAAFQAAHQKRLALLEADAKAQSTPERARVHDYARLNSYIALHRGDDAIEMLTERTQQLPTSYEAWARLASAYHQLGRDDDAIVACNRSIELSYGPRRLRYRTLLADIYKDKHDVANEKKAVAALVDDAEKLPDGQRDDATIAKAKARLAKL